MLPCLATGSARFGPSRGTCLPLRTTRIVPRLITRSLRRLTFEMRGGRQQAKLAVGRPLDRRVRLTGDDPACRAAPDLPNGLVTKRTNACGRGEAGATADSAARRCGTPQ